MRETVRKALQLCLLALTSYLLFYGIGVYLARALGVSGYKTYSVAIATLTLLASFTTLGLEKYAVRALPAFYEGEDWSRARGFTHFGRNLILSLSLVVVVAFASISMIRALATDHEPTWATLLAVVFLPVVVAATFLLEILSASGQVVRATIVYRIAFPLSILAVFAVVGVSPAQLSPVWAIAAFGTAWLVSFILLGRLVHGALPQPVHTADGLREPALWLRKAAPFLIHSVMMTQFASLGVVGLEILGSPEREIAVFAAAMQTGGFVVLLATATNRLYGPLASLVIERRDYRGLIATIRERHSWIIPATLVFMGVIALFGRRILEVFGPEFSAGFPALCWIAGGATVSVWFAMAPSYLKFVGRNSLVLGVTAAAGILNIALLAWLGPRHGATGAGAAYGISLAAMAITLLVLGLREARKLKRA